MLEKKLQKLDKFFDEESTNATVTFSKRKNKFTVEITIFSAGTVFRCESTEDDFRDPLLRNLYLSLSEGASAASLCEEQVEDATRARVSKLLLTPPADDTDQLIRMAQDCLDRNRLKRSREELSTLEASLPALTGAEKIAALQRAQTLMAQISKYNAHRS